MKTFVWFFLSPIRVLASLKMMYVCSLVMFVSYVILETSYKLPMVLKESYAHRDKAQCLCFG
jgi:hypothetical protein